MLVIRPQPKIPGEVPLFVLPRGSRQWVDGAGEYHDIRDAETAIAHADALEPLTRTLTREIEEEAGVSADALARAEVVELGAMDFQSRSKGVYAIHWFRVQLAEADATRLMDTLPVDATAMRWATRAEIQALIDADDFSAGYLPVIDRALSI